MLGSKWERIMIITTLRHHINQLIKRKNYLNKTQNRTHSNLQQFHNDRKE